MRYIPHTEADKAHMLKVIGVDSLDALFASIPEALQLNRPLAVPEGLGEYDLKQVLVALAEANTPMGRSASFLGAGVYRHFAPSVVSQLLLRGELYTAYTPYQPEIAQGTLQIVFEFQTMVSELLGVDVVNASMYDGATAVAEAALMALRCQKAPSNRVIVSRAIHPHYRETTKLFVESMGAEYVEVGFTEAGVTDLDAVARELEKGVVGPDGTRSSGAAAVCLGYPTFFGTLDDLARGRALCDAHDAMLVSTFSEAVAFGLIEPPGSFGPDIVAGEGQSLGVPASNGGPHLGLFGTSEKLVRQMPGRLAGETVDSRGNRGFVLTLSTREQHIRREKATSNICTNVALMATASTIAMTMLGPNGLETVARASHLRAEETKAAVLALPGFSARFQNAPTFNEFVVRTPAPAAEIVAVLADEGVAPGVALSAFDYAEPDALLVTATELTTPEDIARLVAGLRRFAR
jgi:glycine dehydrogenase subunit 1